MTTTQRIVMFSGGAGSWATARRVADTHGTDGLVLLFADTLTEDEDLYRFLRESAENVGGELVIEAEGRDIWQVFRDERMIGNSRIDPCSKILKRKLLRKWIDTKCDPENTVVYLGIDWSEVHRFERAARYWEPWTVEAPLCDPPYLSKADVLEHLEREGIRPPRLYELGFAHNNCGGFCVKAGKAQFRLLLQTMPERYAYHEAKEEEMRAYLGKDVAVLRERRGGVSRRVTMRELRERIEAEGDQLELDDWGGCGCFSPMEDDETEGARHAEA